MGVSYVFADEAGDFVFKRKKGASRYFVLCTVSSPSWSLSEPLLALRRRLAVEGEPERDKLHATTDFQQVRNEVFEALSAETFRVDATILDKPKSQPSIRETDHMFYQYAWYYHFKHFAARARQGADKFLITAAALGEKKTRAAFKAAVNNPIQQVLSRDRWEVAFHESCKDPLLWVADYCAWAIQRKWEMQDTRSYDIIKTKIATEFDLFKHGTTEYY